MMDIYLAKSENIEEIIELINLRIEWMNQEGINQWNKSNYLETFTLDYFHQVIDNKQLYICVENDITVGAFTLFENDDRWTDNTRALYIHNLVSLKDHSGVGEAILNFCVLEAVRRKRHNLRIDCQTENTKLNEYYEKRGFVYVSSFVEENYSGNRRERKIY